MHLAEVGRLADPRKAVLVALGLEGGLELPVAVEVVLEGHLVATGDDEHVVETGAHGLLDDVLDRRLVDDGQHLLRRGLGRGEEAGAQSSGRDDGLRDAHAHTLLVGNRPHGRFRRATMAP